MITTRPSTTSLPRLANSGHKGKGKGGGQFAKKGDSGAGDQAAKDAHAQRVQRAKQAHNIVVGASVQQHAEENNEPWLAKELGGERVGNNAPADIVIKNAEGKITHGIELKTMVKNANDKITMKGDALARKRTWSRKNKAPFHTVVLDDREVFDAGGQGVHDFTKRRILYRRGVGSFRISKMYACKDTTELKNLIEMASKKLPPGAK